MLSRNRVAELMDNPELDPGSHAEALRGLERLNLVSTSADLLWTELKKFSPKYAPGKPIRVLDLATGGGDIPIGLYKRAQTFNRPFEFVGADISSTAIDYAKSNALKEDAAISFVQFDALSSALPGGIDVVMTSLFTHHLDPDQVIDLLKRMRDSTAQLVLVNDLVRSELSLALVWLATRIFSRSPIVQYDGPVSVRASYTIAEMKAMAEQAGLNGCFVKSCPPCRQLLVWRRPDEKTYN